MQRVDRGGGRRPVAVVVLVLVAIVGAGLAGRLAETSGEGTTPSAVALSPTSSPTASASEAASEAADAGFTWRACPPAPMSIVRAQGPAGPPVSPGRLTTVARSAAWLDVVAGRGPTGDRPIWVLARGRLVRLDGVTLAPTHSWASTDSPIWAPDGIAQDRANGVFMWDATMIRDVSPDGAIPVAPVPTAMPISGVADGPDGAPWIAVAEDGSSGSAMLRWSGALWTRTRPCERAGDAPSSRAALAVDPDGRLVVVDAVGGSVRIRRFDGQSWTVFLGMAGLGDPQTTPSVAIAPDGTVYLATGRGIGRFDGSSWSSRATADTRVVVLADGSLATFAPTPLGDTEMTHLDGGTLRRLEGQAPALLAGPVAGAALAPDGLVVASPASIGTGLTVVRFQTPGRSLTFRSVDADVPWLRGARDRPGAPLLALSRHEAWFGSWEGLAWHLTAGALTARDVSEGAASTIRAMARSPDGSVWIGHDADLTVIRPSGASLEAGVDAVSIAARRDGTMWLLGSDGTALLGSLSPSGVVADAAARPPFDWGARIVVDGADSAWALGGSLVGPDLVVVRLVGGRWTVVPRPADAAIVTIAADPRHGIWALASRPDGRVVVLRDEGSGWRSAADVPMLAATDLAVGRDGIVWVAGDALARTDGAGRWETIAGAGSIHDAIRRYYAPSVAPDGTVYVICPSGICRYDPNATEAAGATP